MFYAGVLVLLTLLFLRPAEWVTAIYGWPLVEYTMMILLPFWVMTLSRKKLLRTPEDICAFLFWIICTLSYLTVSPIGMYDTAIETGKVLLVYLFVVHVIDSRRKLLGTYVTIVLMLVFVALMAQERIKRGEVLYDSIGSFANRNEFAGAMTAMLAIATAFLLKGKPLMKMLGGIASVVGVIAIMKSNSRGGQLAAMAAVYTIICLRAKTPAGRKAMAAGAVVVLLLAFSVSERLGTITQYRQDASAMGRVYAWREAFWAFMQNPLLGVGYYNFTETYGTLDTHSSFMRALAELGGLGLMIYVGLIFSSLRNAYRAAMSAQNPTTRMLATGMTGLLVGHLVASLTMTHLYYAFVHVEFALASALRLIVDRERTEAQARGELAPEPAYDTGTQNVWERSLGPGFLTPRLVSMKDLLTVGGLTMGVWVAYRTFVMISHS